MKIDAAAVLINRTRVAIALVGANVTEPTSDAGDRIIRLVQPFFPLLPIMLVSIQDNGFRAYAHFQTPTLLSLVQLLAIPWQDYDLANPPAKDYSPEPF